MATVGTMRAVTGTALREIPLTETVPGPSAPTASDPLCLSLKLGDFNAAIRDAMADCRNRSTYVWSGPKLPTNAQRLELCGCTKLIEKFQQVKIPRCAMVQSGQLYLYRQEIENAFALCNITAMTTAPPTASPTGDNAMGSSGSGTGAGIEKNHEDKTRVTMIAGIVGGALVLLLICVAIAYRCGRRLEHSRDDDSFASAQNRPRFANDTQFEFEFTATTVVATSPSKSKSLPKGKKKSSNPKKTASTSIASSAGTEDKIRLTDGGAWNDPIIIAVRIPADAIVFGKIIGRGAYGIIYKGKYKHKTVAIKQLLPERSKDLRQIDTFLSEVKLMAALDHERIVQFVGVAWNALSDVCFVSEFMENGDLRSALNRFEHSDVFRERRPCGFDADKIKIALHVAHALTYLHSLQPAVVHRDLKSRNILLTATYDAKVTDFGTSRERADNTMTAGVGSSLWMAPEVMLGERYDEKADVFSFGVVLSELDTHQLPYAHARDPATGRRIPNTAILQMVSLGHLSVEFSRAAEPELVALGQACVSVDPRGRPSSAQVLHRVHQVSRRLGSRAR